MRHVMTALVFALTVAWGAPASAQAQPEAQPDAAYTQAKLEAFVDATQEIGRVVRKWRTRIEGAESRERRREIRQQVNEEATAAVAATDGISVEEFVRINQAARDDTDLQGRIKDILADRQAR